MGGSGGSVSSNTTAFTGIDVQSTQESNVQHVMPITQTFTKFYCFGPKPTAGNTDVFTVRANGVAKAGTCTIPSGGTSVVVATVNITVNAGELVDVEVKQGNEKGAVTWGLAP